MQVIVYKVKSHVHANIGFEGVGIWSSNEYHRGHTKAFRSPFCEQMLFTTFPTMVSQKKNFLQNFHLLILLGSMSLFMIPITGFLLYYYSGSSLISSRDIIFYKAPPSLFPVFHLLTINLTQRCGCMLTILFLEPIEHSLTSERVWLP
jgi:hypothetical protein